MSADDRGISQFEVSDDDELILLQDEFVARGRMGQKCCVYDLPKKHTENVQNRPPPPVVPFGHYLTDTDASDSQLANLSDTQLSGPQEQVAEQGTPDSCCFT